MKRPMLVLCTLAVSSLVTLGAIAEVRWIHAPAAKKQVAASPASTSAEPAKARQKWVATKAIINENGRLRRPSEAETASLVRSLRELTAASSKPLTPVAAANGAEKAAIEGGSPNVILARPTADGGVETMCVQTFEEGAAFLGLVAQAPGRGE